jgi:polysaccharide pyruvyl transferase CsaB
MINQSKKILIAGAPTGCWSNAGDEAVLAAMVKDLHRAATDVELTIVSSNPKGALARFGVQELPYTDLPQLIKAAKSTDLMILGGGSIFYDYWGFAPETILTKGHEGLAFYSGFALLATLLNKPLMIYAVGVGPLQSEIGRSFTRLAFEQAQVITVRDSESRQLLESLGGKIEPVRVTADPAFGLEASDIEHVRRLMLRELGSEIARPIIGVALREWDIGVQPEEWEAEVAAGLDQFIKKNGGTALFVPFHKTVDWPLTNDLAVAERVRSRMQQPAKTLILEGEYLPQERAGILQNCDLVLGMRLHSVIFAIEGAVPTVALTYDPKVSSVMSSVGGQPYSLDINCLTSQNLLTLLDRAYENRSQLRELLSRKRAVLADLGQENARLAAQLLRGGTPSVMKLSSFAGNLLQSSGIEQTLRIYGLEGALKSPQSQATTEAIATPEFADPSAGELGASLDSARRSAILSRDEGADRQESSRKRSRPRVACLTNRLLDWDTREPCFGGGERYALALGELLTDLGFEITFYQVASHAFEGDYYGFKVIALPPGESFSEFQVGVCNAFYQLTADSDYVIYLTPNYASGQVREDALVVCHGIWFDHDYYQEHFAFRSPEWFTHLYKAFSNPRRVVSVDTNSINVMRSWWPELASRMTYLPNWVDTKLFHPPAERTSNPVTVIFPRRSDRIRGSHLLGAILEHVPHDCLFWWVGEGTVEDNEYIEAVERRDPRLKFHTASFQQMPRLYQEADICVIPTVASEGTSLSCLEALASACAVVTTTVGGLPELIQHDVNGLLVDPQAEQIAAAINRLIEQPEERARLQQAGAQMVAKFSLEVWQKRWVELLSQLGWLKHQIHLEGGRVKLGELEGVSQDVEPVNEQAQSVDLSGSAQEQEEEVQFLRSSESLYDVICFSSLDWEFGWQRPQHIMSQFAAHGHRVFFLSPTRFLPANEKPYKVRPLRNNVWEVQIAAPLAMDIFEGPMSDEVAHFIADNLSALRDEFNITRALSVVQLATWARAAYLARQKLAWPVVYDCINDRSFPSGGDTQNALLTEERQLARTADLLVLSNRALSEKWAAQNANSVLAPNGADFAHFHEAQPNTLLADAPGAVVGYFGAIAEWFDMELMARLAQERPDYTFVLLGDIINVSVDGLKALPNVRLLEHQPYTMLPGYLLNFDACIIPFKMTPASGTDELVKFYEYISQGKPVVAPSLPELQSYSDYLYLAANQEDFIGKLDLALQEDDEQLRERRITLARQNSWSARLALLKQAIGLTQQKLNVAELCRVMIPALLQDGLDLPSEDRKTALLKKTALHMAAGLTEREQTVEVLKARVVEYEQTTRLQAKELEAKDDIISSRDEGIEWMRQELAKGREEYQRIADLNASLRVQIAEKEALVQASSSQLAEKELTAQILLEEQQREITKLATQGREKEAQLQRLLPEVESEKKRVEEVTARLLETERDLWYRSAQVEERENTIAERDEAIAWLKAELKETERLRQRLTATNQLLSAQLSKTEYLRQTLATRTATVEGEIERIHRTLGWRLLSRYGRIKYKYLLPLYRRLNRAAESSPTPAPQIPTEPAEIMETQVPGLVEEDRTIQELLAQLAQLNQAPKPLSVELEEATEQADFYQSLTLLPHLRKEELPAILDHKPPEAPLHRADVICFSIIDWEFRYQRPQQIMSQFAAHGHRVFYISTTRFQAGDATPRVAVKQIKDNVYEIHLAATRMPDVYGEVMDGDNQRALLDSLDELRRLYHINEAIGYVMIASWGAVALEAKQLWGWHTIYDCMDEWENFPGIKRDILDMELRLVRESDLLVVTAQRLWEKWEAYERPMVLARNAVDYEFYARHYRPNTLLPEVKHPVIGYYGAIADWFDIELLAYVAGQRPDYTFVLLGGVFDVDVLSLKALPNVQLLGQQPYETMPQYLYHFDVCIIPFKINPITEATDPVKLYEYFSAGKPVVSVALPELDSLRDYLYIAQDQEDFVVQLDKAVAEDDSDMMVRRRQFAEQQTWAERYQRIAAGLREVTPRASIIVVTYNNLALNKLCLESLIRNTDYLNYEVIVVDNHSMDGTPAYLRYLANQYPQISIILNSQNHGFARANNQGIARSTGDYLVLLNNDTIVPPGWLSRLLRHLQLPEIGMVGPLTNFVGNEAKIEVPYVNGGELEAFAREHTWAHEGEIADIHMLAMFCVALRRNTYEIIGPLDEQFGIGMFEDDDYTMRLKRQGYRVICAADVFVHHFGQAAFKKLIETGEYNPLFDENRQRYESKWNVKWVPHKNAKLSFKPITQTEEKFLVESE